MNAINILSNGLFKSIISSIDELLRCGRCQGRRHNKESDGTNRVNCKLSASARLHTLEPKA